MILNNWIDILLIVLIVYAGIDGWRRGVLTLIATCISFLVSLWFSVRYNAIAGHFLMSTFGLTRVWTTVLGYAAVGVVSYVCIEVIMLSIFSKLPDRIIKSPVNSVIGSVVSCINMLIFSAFVLLLILALPLRGTVRQDIRNAHIARQLVVLAENYGGQVTSSLEEFAHTATKFLTVEPGSQESINIDVPENLQDLQTNYQDEQYMVKMVNTERARRNITELQTDDSLSVLAREKSKDMFVRRYFSHYDPDVKDASDRADASGIRYGVIGENLAYAPDVLTAHTGLMESQGHKENILEERFHRIGIGIVDAGIYGKMFTQIFTD